MSTASVVFTKQNRGSTQNILMLLITSVFAGIVMMASTSVAATPALNNDAAIYYLVTHWQGSLWATLAAGGTALRTLGYLVTNFSGVRAILISAGLGGLGAWSAAWAIVSTVGLGTILSIFGSAAALA